MIRQVLAKEPDEPICDPCALALGGQGSGRHVTLSTRTCCLCGHERRCAAIRDWDWPAAQKRRVHDEPDDYSELETVLSRPVALRRST